MNKTLYIESEEFSIGNIYSVISYIKENLIPFLLLLLVPIIIYIVDHISNINAIIFSFPSPVIGLPIQNNKSKIHTKIKIPKKSRNI